MIFGAKPLFSANKNIDAIFSDNESGSRTGAIILNQKEGRKTVKSGRIYFRKNLVYAVEIDTLPIPIGKRVATGGLVDYDELKEICGIAGGYANQKVVDLLLERQLISTKVINVYIKEHFLSLMEEILSWDNCEGHWVEDETTKNFIMPYVEINKIRAILENRRKYRNGFKKSVQGFFSKEEIDQLTFVASKQDPADLNNEFIAVLGYANGEYTVAQIAEQTGITEFNTLQAVISLWQENFLHIQLGGIKLPFASLIKRVNEDKEKPVEAPYKEEIIPLEEPSTEEQEAPQEEPVAEEDHDEEIILQGTGEETGDYTLPNVTAGEEQPEESGDEHYHILVDDEETPAEPDNSDVPLILIDEEEEEEEEDTVPEPVIADADDVEHSDAILSEEDEPSAREVSKAGSEDVSVAEPVTPTEEETPIVNTPNKTARASKLQDFTQSLTALQGSVAELETQLDVSDGEYDQVAETVRGLEEQLAAARERQQTIKDERDKIAAEYEKACNEVASLVSSFQMGS